MLPIVPGTCVDCRLLVSNFHFFTKRSTTFKINEIVLSPLCALSTLNYSNIKFCFKFISKTSNQIRKESVTDRETKVQTLGLQTPSRVLYPLHFIVLAETSPCWRARTYHFGTTTKTQTQHLPVYRPMHTQPLTDLEY